jgi:hypothetical protein
MLANVTLNICTLFGLATACQANTLRSVLGMLLRTNAAKRDNVIKFGVSDGRLSTKDAMRADWLALVSASRLDEL